MGLFGKLFKKKQPFQQKACATCGSKQLLEVRFCPVCGFEFKQTVEKYDTFISYRRQGGSELATVIKLELERYGKYAFFDVDEMQTGRFDEQLLKCIEHAPNFILILTEGCLDRCANKTDWLKREILHAIQTRRNIIPVIVAPFSFPDQKLLSLLPDDMRTLQNYHAVQYNHTDRNGMVRIILRYLVKDVPAANSAQSTETVISSGLNQEVPAVKKVVEEIDRKTGHIASGESKSQTGAGNVDSVKSIEKPVADKSQANVVGSSNSIRQEAKDKQGSVPAAVSGFRMVVEDVFSITGRGTVFTGRIENAPANVGDEVKIIQGSKSREAIIIAIELFGKQLQNATQGSNVGLLLRGIEKSEFSCGAVIQSIHNTPASMPVGNPNPNNSIAIRPDINGLYLGMTVDMFREKYPDANVEAKTQKFADSINDYYYSEYNHSMLFFSSEYHGKYLYRIDAVKISELPYELALKEVCEKFGEPETKGMKSSKGAMNSDSYHYEAQWVYGTERNQVLTFTHLLNNGFRLNLEDTKVLSENKELSTKKLLTKKAKIDL